MSADTISFESQSREGRADTDRHQQADLDSQLPSRPTGRSLFTYMPIDHPYKDNTHPTSLSQHCGGQHSPRFITSSRRGSHPTPINTNTPPSSARSIRVPSFLSPSITSARSASHPYNTPLPPSTPRSIMTREDGRAPPSSSISSLNSSPGGIPSSAVLAYNPGTLNNGLKVSPRRRRPPAFPSSPRTMRRIEPIGSPSDYCETPAILRVPPSPRDGSLSSSGFPHGRTPITPSPTSALPLATPLNSPFGVQTSNVRGEPSESNPNGPSYSRAKERRASATTRQTAKLEGVPHAYVVKSLRKLARSFWGKTATSDVTILIPMRQDGQNTPSPTSSILTQVQSESLTTTLMMGQAGRTQPGPTITPTTVENFAPPHNMMGFGAPLLEDHNSPRSPRSLGVNAAKQPQNEKKVLSFPLHADYLMTQSPFFRSLLQPTSSPPQPLYADVSESTTAERPTSSSGPRVKGARVLATPVGMPTTLWVPLPDPGSFGVIAHWMYWGDAQSVESALSGGHVSWQGIVKNIEYLELDDSIKKVIGIWWRRWVKVEAGRRESADGTTVPIANVGLRRRRESKDENMSDDGIDEKNAVEGDDEADLDLDGEDSKGAGMQLDDGDESEMTGLLEAL